MITSNTKTIHYLITLLKKYGIRYIVASPGMQNSKFNALVQEDKDFECYSVVDERSAAYFATGIACESEQPVAITCTGATASRNYISALTEAYYRKIPIIAITFFNYGHNKYNLSPQYVDRKSIQNDIVYESVELPRIDDNADKEKVIALLNGALYTAKYKKLPVHINCPSAFDFKDLSFEMCEDVWIPTYYENEFDNLHKELENKAFAIFMGSHNKLSNSLNKAISNFALTYDIPVICDHTSNYKGENKVLISTFVNQIKNIKKPELLIDIGLICGEYACLPLVNGTKFWRISEDGEFRCRQNKPVDKIFNCKEEYFFEKLCNHKIIKNGYYSSIKSEIDKLNLPELPLCNALVCQYVSKYIPNDSSLHLAILNSLRSMNFFNLDSTIDVTCNVGGFGIDGPLSTICGQSIVNKNKNYFAIIGDLAFFYDMNALGLKYLDKNLKIILINNNRGEEFRVNPLLEDNLGEKTDLLIAAAGHYKNGAKLWAESCGFEYLYANDKNSFINQIKEFCSKDYGKPAFFEIITANEDEKTGLNLLKNIKQTNTVAKKDILSKIKNIFKGK